MITENHYQRIQSSEDSINESDQDTSTRRRRNRSGSGIPFYKTRRFKRAMGIFQLVLVGGLVLFCLGALIYGIATSGGIY